MADLFRDQANHEDDDRAVKEQGGHIGEPALGEVGKAVVKNSGDKEGETDRQKDPERGKKRGDLGDDQEKTGAVAEQPDLAFAGAGPGVDWQVFDAAATAQVAKGQG